MDVVLQWFLVGLLWTGVIAAIVAADKFIRRGCKKQCTPRISGDPGFRSSPHAPPMAKAEGTACDIEAKEIAELEVEKKDVFIFQFEGVLSRDAAENIKSKIERLLEFSGLEGIDSIILDDGTKLKIPRPGA